VSAQILLGHFVALAVLFSTMACKAETSLAYQGISQPIETENLTVASGKIIEGKIGNHFTLYFAAIERLKGRKSETGLELTLGGGKFLGDFKRHGKKRLVLTFAAGSLITQEALFFIEMGSELQELAVIEGNVRLIVSKKALRLKPGQAWVAGSLATIDLTNYRKFAAELKANHGAEHWPGFLCDKGQGSGG